MLILSCNNKAKTNNASLTFGVYEIINFPDLPEDIKIIFSDSTFIPETNNESPVTGFTLGCFFYFAFFRLIIFFKIEIIEIVHLLPPDTRVLPTGD